MLSDLNDYLLNDLSMIVIEYIKFSEKQLALLMNEKTDEKCIKTNLSRWMNRNETKMLGIIKKDYFRSWYCQFTDENRLTLLSFCKPLRYRMAHSNNFSIGFDITKAYLRQWTEHKRSIHFHGSTIVVADDDKTFRVYDFNLDFT
jgi:hypothetical protein